MNAMSDFKTETFKVRKSRTTKKEIINFINWLNEHEDYKRCSDGQLSILYLNETNVFIPQVTITNNRKKYMK